MATQPDTATPWYRQPAARPKIVKSFNIYKEHLLIIEEKSIEASALVRLLMDKYFSGELPEVRAAYERGEGRQ